MEGQNCRTLQSITAIGAPQPQRSDVEFLRNQPCEQPQLHPAPKAVVGLGAPPDAAAEVDYSALPQSLGQDCQAGTSIREPEQLKVEVQENFNAAIQPTLSISEQEQPAQESDLKDGSKILEQGQTNQALELKLLGAPAERNPATGRSCRKSARVCKGT